MASPRESPTSSGRFRGQVRIERVGPVDPVCEPSYLPVTQQLALQFQLASPGAL